MKTKNDKELLAKMAKAKKIVIWGAGYHTEEILNIYHNIFENIQLIIVDRDKAGQKISGFEINRIDTVSFEDVDLVIIMTGIHMESIVDQLRKELNYQKEVVGLYEFRRKLAAINGNIGFQYHIRQFIEHMENGAESYSYDAIFKNKFSAFRVIKVFAYWASSIGESVRYLLSYYFQEYVNRKTDEFYLLMPFIKGRDFANGSFIEILSREIPMVNAENCIFWKYVMEKYEERFDFGSYNIENGILVDAYNLRDPMMCRLDMYNRRVDLLKYNEKEIRYGESELKRMGIDREYVCIFARDSKYLSYQYHQSYTGNDMRNMDIRDYGLSLEYLASQNIQSVRVGKVVDDVCELKNCVDYASTNHQDFLDLYLIYKCKFFIGSCSGIVELAHLQNKPVLLIGLTQFGIFHSINYHEDDLYIPKKVFDKKADRYLNLWEMLDVEMKAGVRMLEYYSEHELIFVDPSQQEIQDAVQEMNEKLDHTYQSKRASALLEKYFKVWDHWLETRGYEKYYFGSRMKICECFLQNNEFFLDI